MSRKCLDCFFPYSFLCGMDGRTERDGQAKPSIFMIMITSISIIIIITNLIVIVTIIVAIISIIIVIISRIIIIIVLTIMGSRIRISTRVVIIFIVVIIILVFKTPL